MAYELYRRIDGTKQGTFEGESDRQAHQDRMPGFSFGSAIASPRDAATGQATGKRHHEPVVMRKKVAEAVSAT